MKREDSIKILKHIRNVEPDVMIMVAYDIAIEALEREPLEVKATELQKAYNKGFEDCRQAALNMLNENGGKWGTDYYEWVNAVKDIETLCATRKGLINESI